MSEISSPKHYQLHPSGVECIEVTRHMPFTVGNVVKYLWRAGLKGPEEADLRKARQYAVWAAEDQPQYRLGDAGRKYLYWYDEDDLSGTPDSVIYHILRKVDLTEVPLLISLLIRHRQTDRKVDV